MTAQPASIRSALRRGWWRWAVGLGLLFALIWWTGPSKLASALTSIDAEWAVLTGLGIVALVLVAGFNVWVLLRRLAPFSLASYLKVYVRAWGIGLIVPGGLGDASQILFLRAKGIDMEASAASYVLDKVITLTWFTIVGVYGVGHYFSPELRWLPPVALVALLAAAILSMRALGHIPTKPGTLPHRIQARLLHTRGHIASFRNRGGTVALNVGLTIFKWAIQAAVYVIAFRAVGVHLSLTAAATIPVMTTLVGYVPISVGGLGVVEYAAITMFGKENIEQTAVITTYLMLRGTQILVAAALLGAFSLVREQETALEVAPTGRKDRA